MNAPAPRLADSPCAALPVGFVHAFGNAEYALKNGDVAAYERACQKAAGECPEVWLGLGSSEMQAGNLTEAMLRIQEAYDGACAQHGARAERTRSMCLNNMGTIYAKWFRNEQAEECFREGLRLQPRVPELLANLALCLLWKNDVAGAIKQIDAAIRQKPDFHQAYFSRSLMHLVSGDLLQGFRGYESRFKNPTARTRKLAVDIPEWDGFNPRGKTILLYSEQGAGDTIQFVRYAPRIARAGGRVYVACQKGLRDLLLTIEGIERVFEPMEALPLHEIHAVIPIMSLPRVFRTTLEVLRTGTAALRAGPSAQESPALGAVEHPYIPLPPVPPGRSERGGSRLRLGICWAGSADHAHDHLRSIPYREFSGIFEGVDVELVSLQVGPRSLEAPVPGTKGTPGTEVVAVRSTGAAEARKPCAAPPPTYLDTARIIAGLDLVIACDTSVVHLAGAMGKPAWVLLPYSPDWRWLLGRSDTPWYPSVKLFRQPAPLDWQPVIEQVRTELMSYGD